MGSCPIRAADAVAGQLRTQWETTKGLVMGIAAVFPEDKFDSRPTPQVRTFREQLIHLAGEV